MCFALANGNLGESIMARLPDTKNEQSKVTTVLRAIGNSKRLRILRLLSHIYDHDPVMRPRRH
jgi:DNA-binding transcriptional ArsR family regulator